MVELMRGQAERAVREYNTGHRHLDDVRRDVFGCGLTFIKHTLKTNFFVLQKQLAVRSGDVARAAHRKDDAKTTQAFGKIYHGAFETAYVGRKCDDPPSWSEPHWYGSPRYYFTPQGIEIARRTVAKYREVLGILPSSRRKKYF